MYRLMSSLLRPYPLLFLVIAAVLVYLWWRRREMRRGIVLISIPFVVLVIISTPVVGSWALATLENRYPTHATRPDDVEVIVVFGGGVLRADTPDLPPVPSADTLYRCMHAAHLYHSGPPCLVVVSCSGEDADRGLPSSAAAMRDVLLSMGVRPDDLVMDDRARTTFENAAYSREQLQERGIDRAMLVTQAMHMERSRRALEAQGIETIPAPCHFQSRQLRGGIADWFPSTRGAADFQAALHEWAGLAWYRLHGRL